MITARYQPYLQTYKSPDDTPNHTEGHCTSPFRVVFKWQRTIWIIAIFDTRLVNIFVHGGCCIGFISPKTKALGNGFTVRCYPLHFHEFAPRSTHHSQQKRQGAQNGWNKLVEVFRCKTKRESKQKAKTNDVTPTKFCQREITISKEDRNASKPTPHQAVVH